MFLTFPAALAMSSPAPACAYDPKQLTLAHAPNPTPAFEAAALQWFVKGEPIAYAGGSYVKYGLPRQLGPFEIETINQYQKVPVFIEAGNYVDAPEIIYIMVKSTDCSFQPYVRQ